LFGGHVARGAEPGISGVAGEHDQAAQAKGVARGFVAIAVPVLCGGR
jgi:hypothetical protein